MKKKNLMFYMSFIIIAIFAFLSFSNENDLLNANIEAIAKAKIVAPCSDHPSLNCTWKDGGREHTLTKARPDNPL